MFNIIKIFISIPLISMPFEYSFSQGYIFIGLMGLSLLLGGICGIFTRIGALLEHQLPSNTHK
jgi:hypothetical protein